MTSSKEAATPMTTNCYLDAYERGKLVDQTMFRGIIRSLLYLIASRSNVCLCKISIKSCNKRNSKISKKNHAFGASYLRGASLGLIDFSYSNFGGCNIDRKSTINTSYLLGCL